MKRFIRSIARTMGLAALVSLGTGGCRFDLDSLRKDGGVQIADSGMNDSMALVDGSYADALLPDAALPDASPGGILPSSEFTPDQHCLALYHFNLPDYTAASCGSNLQNNGSSSTDSLAGFHEARFFEGGFMTGSGNLTTSLTDKVTVEALIKPNSETSSFIGGFGNILHNVYVTDDNYQGFALFVMNGALAFNIGLNNGFLFSVTGPASFPTTTYTHIAGTYDGMKGRVLVNGIVIGEATMSGIIGPITMAENPGYSIGADKGGNNAFIGALDEVRVSNTVRYGPTACYLNDFSQDADLEDLVMQNGMWERDPQGYLKKNITGQNSWEIAYVNNLSAANFEAKVKMRMIDCMTGCGVVDNHAGLLFRYNRQSQSGFDPALDHGYLLKMSESDGYSFKFVLQSIGSFDIQSTPLTVCGGCQYNNWHELKIRAEGDTMTAYFNGTLIFTVQNDLFSTGNIGFAGYGRQEYHFDDLEVCPLE